MKDIMPLELMERTISSLMMPRSRRGKWAPRPMHHGSPARGKDRGRREKDREGLIRELASPGIT
jgi:hypothetical protein